MLAATRRQIIAAAHILKGIIKFFGKGLVTAGAAISPQADIIWINDYRNKCTQKPIKSPNLKVSSISDADNSDPEAQIIIDRAFLQDEIGFVAILRRFRFGRGQYTLMIKKTQGGCEYTMNGMPVQPIALKSR